MSSTLSRNDLRQPDGFLIHVRKFFDDIGKHSKILVGLLAVVVVVALIGTLMAGKNAGKSEQGREALFKANKSLHEELLVTVPPQAAPAPATPPAAAKDSKTPATPPAQLTEDQRLEMAAYKKFDVDQTLPKTIKALQAVVNDFGGTRAAYDASVSLGDLYFDHGEAAKAVPWYQKASDAAPSTLDRALAHYALGHAYEASGKNSEAIQNYEKAVQNYDKSNPKTGKDPQGAVASLKGDFLLAIARCYEGMNDKAKAATYYDQVITQFPNTRHSKTAELAKSQAL